MSTPKRKPKSKPKQRSSAAGKTQTSADATNLYSGFEIWESKKKPMWHPVKKMRYVFFRMIDGVTVTDAIREIRWTAVEFWHLIDKKRNDPFRQEYRRAKTYQSRAFADSVVTIAEGRDRTTKMSVKKMHRLVEKGLKKARREKNSLAVKMIVEGLLAQIDHNDHRILGRNKLQIDAAKWVAKTSNPSEFGDSSRMSLSGATPGDPPADLPALRIQFIGPDGKVVKP